ncbi:hypothetical protein LTS13_005824 [Exophiala xenobiotica]|nr:hypothetical protein LTS13_005824 [Exophiala xenobiotica]KAK5402305.1 hypothetical protein LTR79_001033 [Exophiala xenobiotica]KAK5488112.1 hypothetical protein LTR83_007748 [Exophiala xenobiotica]KAK5492799.1 hypothetical protein LTR26_002910 [Exophiala xenobiotica]KAK5519913.1 hypothetical protein LTR21_001603 [Exophiala xenobiotica]
MAGDDIAFDIPEECWAGVVKNEGPNFYIEVEKVPVPEIGPQDVLIKLHVTGLCLTDVHFMANDWKFPKMRDLGVKCAGHEGAGVIVKIGKDVKNHQVGQRAAYGPTHSSCGICEHCRSGRVQYCFKTVFTGGLRDGSYQQYCSMPENYVILIPDGVPDHVAGPAMCSAATSYSSIKASGLKPGQWAVFPGGGGGVGIQGVQLASAMGLRPIVVDTGRDRRELAMSLGAEHFIDFRETDPVKSVIDLTAGGAHGVFVTGKSWKSRNEGKADKISQLYNHIPFAWNTSESALEGKSCGRYHIDVDPTELCLKNHSIKGTLSGTLDDIIETLDFAQRGQ